MANQAFTVSRDKLTGPKESTILITGGSSGIGLQTAILLHDLGNNVVVVDRTQPHSSAPKSLTQSSRFLYQQADITQWKSQRAAFEGAVKKFGSIDGVFVNAGVAEYNDQFFRDELDGDGLLKEPDKRVYDIDLIAANDTARLGIYYMRNKASGKMKGGSIVMTASLAGYLASAGAPQYSAAKHGIVGLMRALKNVTAKLGIAVSVVAPSVTLTDFISERNPGESLRDWAIRMRGLGVPINDPGEIADAVVHLMSQGLGANGKGYLVQAGRVGDVELGIAKTRTSWMGEEMLKLFRGSRDAPLFPSKL